MLNITVHECIKHTSAWRLEGQTGASAVRHELIVCYSETACDRLRRACEVFFYVYTDFKKNLKYF